MQNCWPTEPLSGSSSFHFSTTFSLREVFARFFLSFWLGAKPALHHASPLTFVNLLSKRSSTQQALLSSRTPLTHTHSQVYIITAGVLAMIYTRVVDRDDIEAPAFSTISYHYPPPITYMFRKTLYYATVHITHPCGT